MRSRSGCASARRARRRRAERAPGTIRAAVGSRTIGESVPSKSVTISNGVRPATRSRTRASTSGSRPRLARPLVTMGRCGAWRPRPAPHRRPAPRTGWPPARTVAGSSARALASGSATGVPWARTSAPGSGSAPGPGRRRGFPQDHGCRRDAGQQADDDRHAGPHEGGAYQYDRCAAPRTCHCYDARPMEPRRDRVQDRILPAVLTALGVTFLAAGLLTWTVPVEAGPPPSPPDDGADRERPAAVRRAIGHAPAARNRRAGVAGARRAADR